MSVLSKALADTIGGRALSYEQAVAVMEEILAAEAVSAPLVAGLLCALQTRGLNEEIVCAAVEVLGRHALAAPVNDDRLVDCCGTGGDVKFSFNVSTAAGIVAASAGARVSKHGNRSVSSLCGSADVLAQAGVDLDSCARVYTQAITDIGFGFLFAPSHHKILARLAPVRRALGVPTVFNLTGPLLNPSQAPYQLLGTWSAANQQLLADCLSRLGRKKAWVVRAQDGMDELSIFCRNEIIEIGNNKRIEFTIDPNEYDLGLSPDQFEKITVADGAAACQMLWQALGEPESPAGKITRLNAGAVLYLSGVYSNLRLAIDKARQAQLDGSSTKTLRAYIALFDKPDAPNTPDTPDTPDTPTSSSAPTS
ncbi:MAG: anthranilate phosphoribosyltransferase [Gammaproteobacteria bacterium]|nr:anthranilate phosphoribosyltransferase [Gammaproteobacteria bacterium]